MPDDTAELLGYLDRALTITPERDAGRVRLLEDRARVLREAGAPAAEVAEALRTAYVEAQRHGGMALHSAAGTWARDRAATGDWPVAAEAGDDAVSALETVVRLQTHLYHRRALLRSAGSLTTLTADALRRTGHAARAAVFLERGQAMTLVDQYARPAVVEQLLRGHDDTIALKYRTLVDAVRRFNANDTELRAAQADLARFVDSTARLPGMRDLLEAARDPRDLLVGSAFVYVTVGFAIVVNDSGTATPIELPDLTENALWRVQTKFIRRVVLGRDEYLSTSTVESTCRWLDRVVMGPLEPALQGLESIILIATGTLAGLPLHATATAAGRRTHSYLPAAALARAPVPPFDSDARAVAVVDPERSDVTRLAGTKREADVIRQHFAHGPTLHAGGATTETVRAAMVDAELVHFGCHATSNPTEPMDSAILLAGDGRLRLRDLLAAPATLRRTRLVVLSACQTNTVDWGVPSESINLATGMLAAGADAVIGSLWPVPDGPTAELMSRFYGALGQGTPAKAALAQAQRELSDTPLRDWAGFVYVGR